MTKINLTQSDDDKWTMFIHRESGLIETETLGVLSKEQAQREAIRRYPSTDIVCFDKEVCKAIREGRVKGVLPQR
jgi:hypothetical protein